MLRRLFAVALIAIALVAPIVAEAQTTGVAPQVKGRLITTGSGTVPVLSSCGTATVAGNDNAGVITFTAGATACTVTFNQAFDIRPVCWAQNETNTAKAVGKAVASTTALVITFESQTGDSDVASYICLGR